MLARLWLLAICGLLGLLGIHRFWLGLRLSGTAFVLTTIACLYFSEPNRLLIILPVGLTLVDFFAILFTGSLIGTSLEQKKQVIIRSPDSTPNVPSSDKSVTQRDKKVRKSYSDQFKKEVAIAAQEQGVTLKKVGEKFNVSPSLVRNWKIKYQEELAALNSKVSEGVSMTEIQQGRSAIEAVDECGEAIENKFMQTGLFTRIVSNGGGVLNSVSILLQDPKGDEYKKLDDDFIFVIKLYCDGEPDIDEEEVFDIIEPIIDENPEMFSEFGLNSDLICDFKLIVEKEEW